MTSLSDPLLGTVLDGRYQITARLARGGMATVYAAVDTRLTRTVAVKVMHAGLGDDAEFARKFDREARAAARLSHPNVVSVFDQGVDEGRPYIVMEYVEGHTLRDVIGREAPLAPLRALDLVEPVLAALAAAHDAGLVHRDVKPENVLISERNQVKVADFGLAKAVSAQTSTATAGLLIGTVSYLPPELVLSGRADARSDVYSAGVVLFELLTGRKPHVGDTPIQVAYAHVNVDVPAPSSLPTAGPVPDYLDAFVASITARDPQARPHDARVMLTQLRRVRSALRQGVARDPELTQDLTVPLRSLAGAAEPTPVLPDRADREATTFVPATPAPRRDTRFEEMPDFSSPVSPNSWPPPELRTAPAPIRSSAAAAPTRTATPRSPVTPRRPGDAEDRLQARREEQRQRRRTRRIRGAIVLVVVLMLAAMAALAGWYLAAGRFTATPTLVGQSQVQAGRIAAQAGVHVSWTQAWSETVAAGTVISTDPGPGAKMVADGTVTALVSKGPERYPVPTIEGLTRAKAEAALVAGHLAVGDVSEVWDEKVADGVVITGSEPKGTALRRDTEVDLTVSKGPRPVPIASWEGKSAADAKTALTKAGFKVTITDAHSGSVPAGDVISQSPKSGHGYKGDTITLERSLGPVMVTVPMVKSMGIEAAKTTMAQAGFQVRTARASLYLGLGYVASSDPPAGSKAPKGSTITLYLV